MTKEKPAEKALMRLWPFIFLGSFLACGPEKTEVHMTKAWSLDPQRFTLEKTEKTLDNGLLVIAVRKSKLPIFHLEMEIEAGSVLDPLGKEGLAGMTGDMLDEGAGGLSSEDIADTFESVGARFWINVGKASTELSLKCLSTDTDALLGVLAKIITSPDFKKDEFTRLRKRTVSSIYSAKSDPNTVLDWSFDETVYDGHPLAHPVIGYDSTVSRITLEDVKGFYKDWYCPARTRVVVVSDLPPDSAVSLVERHLGGWKNPGKPLPTLAPPPKIEGKRVKVVRMPEINQCYIALGARGITRTSPDYNALRTANYILGGSGFSSRITKRIRVELGFAYSVFGYYSPGFVFGDSVYPGIFYAGLETKTSSGNQAISELLSLIADARNKGFTQEELEAAKKYYRGSIARSGETYGQVAGLVMQGKVFGLPDLYWIEDILAISNLSLDEVNSAARSYFDPENFVLVVVADTSFKLEGYPEAEYMDWK
ncbi:MAG: pitrilysin family protein [candidate division WOR-3 bacterium]